MSQDITLDVVTDENIQLNVDAIPQNVPVTPTVVVRSGGGTSDYELLTNKPKINNVELVGNKTASDLSLASASDLAAKYTKPSGGIPTSDLAPDATPKNTVWITYGDTSAFDKIEAAYGEKPVAVRYNDRVYYLATADGEEVGGLVVISSYTLTCLDEDGMLYYVKCTMGSPDTWTNGSIDLTAGGGSGQVFWATYGMTSVAEIAAANAANKLVLCLRNDGNDNLTVFRLVNITDDNLCYFEAQSTGLSIEESIEVAGTTWVYSSQDTFVLQFSGTTAALGTASRGSALQASRADHVHAMPSASDVGAVASAQGVSHAGEFLIVGSDGNVTTKTMTAWQGGSF